MAVGPEAADAEGVTAAAGAEPDRLRAAYRQRIYAAELPAAEADRFLKELEAGLTGYTYLEE